MPFLDLSRSPAEVQLIIDGYIELHVMIMSLLQYHKGDERMKSNRFYKNNEVYL